MVDVLNYLKDDDNNDWSDDEDFFESGKQETSKPAESLEDIVKKQKEEEEAEKRRKEEEETKKKEEAEYIRGQKYKEKQQQQQVQQQHYIPESPQPVSNQLPEGITEADIPMQGPFEIVVTNISYDAQVDDVGYFFGNLNPIKIDFAMRRDNNSHKGFGFVEFATREDMIGGLKMNGTPCKGRPLHMRVKTQKGYQRGQRRQYNDYQQDNNQYESNEPSAADSDTNWRKAKPSGDRKKRYDPPRRSTGGSSSSSSRFGFASSSTSSTARVQKPSREELFGGKAREPTESPFGAMVNRFKHNTNDNKNSYSNTKRGGRFDSFSKKKDNEFIRGQNYKKNQVDSKLQEEFKNMFKKDNNNQQKKKQSEGDDYQTSNRFALLDDE